MMSLPEPIQVKKLSDEIEDRLLLMIRERRLAPGDVVPSERELMALYQVGRPAIREAMQRLERSGVLEIRHGGRPRIAQPSLTALVDQLGPSMRHLLAHSQSSLDDLKEARVALEAEMARIAAVRRTDADLDDLSSILASQQQSASNPELFLEADGRFHRKIAAISRNPIFEAVSHGVFNWLRTFHVEQVRKLGLEALTLSEHASILDAIRKSDGAGAALAMRVHLERANALYHQDNAK